MRNLPEQPVILMISRRTFFDYDKEPFSEEPPPICDSADQEHPTLHFTYLAGGFIQTRGQEVISVCTVGFTVFKLCNFSQIDASSRAFERISAAVSLTCSKENMLLAFQTCQSIHGKRTGNEGSKTQNWERNLHLVNDAIGSVRV